MLKIVLTAAFLAFATVGSSAHDLWSNDQPVPEWVKKSCCGKEDAHNLPDEVVKVTPQGYAIPEYPDVIPYAKALPSPDGTYWAFYQKNEYGWMMFCFFAPIPGV
jgi:hypothetical protein